MSTLTFPTRPQGRGGSFARPGQPTRAAHCRCEPSRQILNADGDGCERCGYWTLETVTRTWQARAQAIAAGRRRRKQAA